MSDRVHAAWWMLQPVEWGGLLLEITGFHGAAVRRRAVVRRRAAAQRQVAAQRRAAAAGAPQLAAAAQRLATLVKAGWYWAWDAPICQPPDEEWKLVADAKVTIKRSLITCPTCRMALDLAEELDVVDRSYDPEVAK